jgi:predicted metal-binding protein
MRLTLPPSLPDEDAPNSQELGVFTKEQVEAVVTYLSIPPWKCPKCGCMNFGRNKYCPANRNGDYCRTLKPEN